MVSSCGQQHGAVFREGNRRDATVVGLRIRKLAGSRRQTSRLQATAYRPAAARATPTPSAVLLRCEDVVHASRGVPRDPGDLRRPRGCRRAGRTPSKRVMLVKGAQAAPDVFPDIPQPERAVRSARDKLVLTARRPAQGPGNASVARQPVRHVADQWVE
eukprot:scaffold12954_cov105-Isochrysis_galbana.AAC.6